MKLVLCVSGGIAASLIPGWVLYLRQIRDWDVQVLLTENATRFVTPTALASLSNNPVYIGNRWMDDAGPIHKEIAQTADVVAVSPCTLNTFAKLSTGLADDAVTLTAAFATCPVVLFPAFSPSEIGRLWKKMHDDVVDPVTSCQNRRSRLRGSLTAKPRVRRDSQQSISSNVRFSEL